MANVCNFQVVFGENEQFGAVRCLIFPKETCIKEPIAEYIHSRAKQAK